MIREGIDNSIRVHRPRKRLEYGHTLRERGDALNCQQCAYVVGNGAICLLNKLPQLAIWIALGCHPCSFVVRCDPSARNASHVVVLDGSFLCIHECQPVSRLAKRLSSHSVGWHSLTLAPFWIIWRGWKARKNHPLRWSLDQRGAQTEVDSDQPSKSSR